MKKKRYLLESHIKERRHHGAASGLSKTFSQFRCGWRKPYPTIDYKLGVYLHKVLFLMVEEMCDSVSKQSRHIFDGDGRDLEFFISDYIFIPVESRVFCTHESLLIGYMVNEAKKQL